MSPPPLRDDPEGTPAPRFRTGWLLQRAHRGAQRQFSAALAEVHIEPPHFGVLLSLADEEPLTQTQLARRNDSDRTGMVRTLDDLEQLGYVRRRQSPTDRRSNEVTLTPEGRTAFVAARRAATGVMRGLLQDLTPEEKSELDRLLGKVINRIESPPAD